MRYIAFDVETPNSRNDRMSSIGIAVVEAGEIVALVEVYMPSVRLSQENRSVNRTVTLPAWLNAQAMERGVNFSQVLQDALRAEINRPRV